MNRVLAFLGIVFFAFSAQAQTQPAVAGAAPLETGAREAVLIEAATGDVLLNINGDASMPTSSMSKVMTMYLVFEAIRSGKLKMDDHVAVSEDAWKQEGSRMFINVGDKVKVEDLVRGVIVQSGNDAAVALAEALAGSEQQFAEMMNAKAKELGLINSHFVNATGLPHPDHYSTANDLARLALLTIRDFPEFYHYYSEKEFTYNKIKQGNRNPLLYRDIGVDGLKTGHAEAAGFGVIASAVRDGRRLVLVVNGLQDMQKRADESGRILEWGFREFGLVPVVNKGEKYADAKVWMGLQKTVPLTAEKDLTLSLPRSSHQDVKVSISYDEPVTAPVAQGQPLGKLTVAVPGKEPVEIPLAAGESVQTLGVFDRLIVKLKFYMGKL